MWRLISSSSRPSAVASRLRAAGVDVSRTKRWAIVAPPGKFSSRGGILRLRPRHRQASPSGGAGDLLGDPLQLAEVDVGHQRVAQLTSAPQDHVEAALGFDRRTGGAYRGQRALGPRQPVGTEHDERDRVQAACVDEHRRLAIQEVADGAALEREVGVALEPHDRGKVQPAFEPWLHLMDTAALDVERMLAGRSEERRVGTECRYGWARGPR